MQKVPINLSPKTRSGGLYKTQAIALFCLALLLDKLYKTLETDSGLETIIAHG